ncbi:hypothetical protein BZG36_01326 [Bifiguratus adelaidae]|uniref:Metalloenzyme domain-containing protein n=1 Tax=Bifiguratus adelaidae TaxID=1938954 RepID=A0A261Y591_9FUNG|nr:hypothetical protein BZG36_01326 [Bifiguratus adelaidae]
MPAAVDKLPRVLAVFDFDWSLINHDSDYWVVNGLAPEVWEETHALSQAGGQWTDLMDRALGRMHQLGITREQIEQRLDDVPVHPGLLKTVELLSSMTPPADLFILSDANTAFIDRILRSYKIRHLFRIHQDEGEVNVQRHHVCGRWSVFFALLICGMSTCKLLFFLVDGLGDVAIPELDHKTPLQYANTPHMDALAACGLSGLMDPVEPGLACGSDTAHMSILGYDPRKYYRGRGAFESMGAGLPMIHGDIAFKSNFATLDQGTNIVLRRRASRHFELEGPILCQALDKCLPSSNAPSPEAQRTCAVINELSREIQRILTNHPVNAERKAAGKTVANCVLLRGAGSRIEEQVPTIQELHGLRASMIAPTCIIAGLGMSIGMDVLTVPGATGDYQTNLQAKGDAAVAAITSSGYDFCFVHIKAVDDAGHDKDVHRKIHFLQEIDHVLGRVVKQLEQMQVPVVITLTGDHSTPVLYGDHSYEPVPVTMARLSANPVEMSMTCDHVTCFDEISARQGALGRFRGLELMGVIKKVMTIKAAANAAAIKRGSAAYYNPNTGATNMKEYPLGTTNYEPVNVIISGLSGGSVSNPDDSVKGGILSWFQAINFDHECFNLHAGGYDGFDSGDGRGFQNQTFIYRENYNDPSGVGSCTESLIGGQHVRGFYQSTSGAWFIAASQEESASQNHNIVPNGYDLGRNYVANNAVKGGTGFDGCVFGPATVEDITNLVAPNDGSGYNHGIGTDGVVKLITVPAPTGC